MGEPQLAARWRHRITPLDVAIARAAHQLAAADPLRRSSARRCRVDELRPRPARGVGGQSLDGTVSGRARRRLVAAKARRDRARLAYRTLVAPALADALH